MNSKIPLVSSEDFIAIAEILESLEGNLTVEKVFRRQGLPRDLRHRPSLFYLNIELIKFIEAAARQSGLEYFGLIAGSMYKFSDLGLFGKYVLEAPNLAVAITRAKRSISYYESGSSLQTVTSNGTTVLRYFPASPYVIGASHQSDAVMLMLIDLVRNFVGDDWRPEYVELNYNTAGRMLVLEDHFQARVVSERQAIGVPIANELLFRCKNSKIIETPPITIHDLHRLRANPLPTAVSDVVLNTIILRQDHMQSNIELIANQLNVGTRTLQRNLNKDGQTFRELVNTAVIKRGNELLADTELSITEISKQLGYTAKQNFIRAYKNQTNMTPNQARKMFDRQHQSRF